MYKNIKEKAKIIFEKNNGYAETKANAYVKLFKNCLHKGFEMLI
jgi:hypothetical protein